MTNFSVTFSYDRDGAECTARVTVPAVDGIEADHKVAAAFQQLVDGVDAPAEQRHPWGPSGRCDTHRDGVQCIRHAGHDGEHNCTLLRVERPGQHSALIGGEVKPYPERVELASSEAQRGPWQCPKCSTKNASTFAKCTGFVVNESNSPFGGMCGESAPYPERVEPVRVAVVQDGVYKVNGKTMRLAAGDVVHLGTLEIDCEGAHDPVPGPDWPKRQVPRLHPDHEALVDAIQSIASKDPLILAGTPIVRVPQMLAKQRDELVKTLRNVLAAYDHANAYRIDQSTNNEAFGKSTPDPVETLDNAHVTSARALLSLMTETP